MHKLKTGLFLSLKDYELQLRDDKVNVIKASEGDVLPYRVYSMGLYLVVETKIGVILMWDKKTSLAVKLSSTYKVSEL